MLPLHHSGQVSFVVELIECFGSMNCVPAVKIARWKAQVANACAQCARSAQQPEFEYKCYHNSTQEHFDQENAGMEKRLGIPSRHS